MKCECGAKLIFLGIVNKGMGNNDREVKYYCDICSIIWNREAELKNFAQLKENERTP